MTAQPFPSLAPDHIAVLRAVARMDLSHGAAISQSLGRPASEGLALLRAEGYVREVASPRKDGLPNLLQTITAKGHEALRSQDQDEQGLSPRAPTVGPRPPLRRETYTGAEMHPFTGRAGSMDALKYPSRIGDQLRYRDDASAPADESAKPDPAQAVKRR